MQRMETTVKIKLHMQVYYRFIYICYSARSTWGIATVKKLADVENDKIFNYQYAECLLKNLHIDDDEYTTRIQLL